VAEAGQGEIVHELRLAAQEARVLQTLHLAADESWRWHGDKIR
jgi:hypothetical protein